MKLDYIAGLVLLLGSAHASEQLTIEQLQEYGASYHLRTVSIVGTVQAMLAFPPLPIIDANGCSPLYGIATFVLADDNGSLPVEVTGSCLPAAADHLPREGDVIRMVAVIHVYIPEGQSQQVIKAVAKQIVVLPKGEQNP